MSGARMNALATLRGQIERIETAEVVHQHDRVALGHGEVDSALKGGLARAVIHEVFCEGRQGAAATGFVMGLAGRVTARRPLLWGAARFFGTRDRRTVDERACRNRSRSAPRGDGARRRCRERAAHLGRCARLRCAGRRRARALGRCQAVRSGGEPQADAGRAIVRCHRPDAADGGAAAALDRGDAVDAARGAFAAGPGFNACGALECLGRAALRCGALTQSSWPVRPVDHGMEM
ncbi:hypothetical protein ABIF64_004319 [Bradyrhizobium japonicum]